MSEEDYRGFALTNIEELEQQTEENSDLIEQNAENIKANVDDIATNVADIATNTADIATNVADIADNASEIALRTHMATGTYTGNGNNNREITGLGFDPTVVLIMQDYLSKIYHYLTIDEYTEWDSSANDDRFDWLTDRCRLITDGFEINNNEANDEFNRNAIVYWYIAWGL